MPALLPVVRTTEGRNVEGPVVPLGVGETIAIGGPAFTTAFPTESCLIPIALATASDPLVGRTHTFLYGRPAASGEHKGTATAVLWTTPSMKVAALAISTERQVMPKPAPTNRLQALLTSPFLMAFPPTQDVKPPLTGLLGTPTPRPEPKTAPIPRQRTPNLTRKLSVTPTLLLVPTIPL